MKKFSYYLAPISNILPLREVNISYVYRLVSSGFLEHWTQKIRRGLAFKSKVLPYVTPSGVFRYRKAADLQAYSGILCIDLDHCETGFKEILSEDTFLKPGLIFISPSGTGLKVFIRIKDAVCDDHGRYFEAVGHYLKSAYGLEADHACRDIARACYLCHDKEAYFSAKGSVQADALLRILPAEEMSGSSSSMESGSGSGSGSRSGLKITAAAGAAAASHLPSERLNVLTVVHRHAENALRRNGWRQKGFFWTRPGKRPEEGISAKFNIYIKEGKYIFTNFSTNAPPFLPGKGYTDTQVIGLLDYGGDFRRCIGDLARKYL